MRAWSMTTVGKLMAGLVDTASVPITLYALDANSRHLVERKTNYGGGANIRTVVALAEAALTARTTVCMSNSLITDPAYGEDCPALTGAAVSFFNDNGTPFGAIALLGISNEGAVNLLRGLGELCGWATSGRPQS